MDGYQDNDDLETTNPFGGSIKESFRDSITESDYAAKSQVNYS